MTRPFPRPPAPVQPVGPRTHHLIVRISAAEHAALTRAAGGKVSVANYVRAKLGLSPNAERAK